MSQNLTPCPLCAGTQSRLFDRRTFRQQPVVNHICQNCGLVYQSPRKSKAELEAFYKQEYRQVYQGSEGPNRRDLLIQQARAEALLAFARPHLPAGARPAVSRHLDIGCSAGLLLQAFQQAYGCFSAGVEPGDAYRQYAQQAGFPVAARLEDLAALEPATPFDLVSLAHVLEHIPDPLEYLVRLRQQVLAPDGSLLIEVPNLYAHESFEIAHLVSYSPFTLSQLLGRAGYTITARRIHGQPRSSILPLYITVLARPAGRQTTRAARESGVFWKRRLGMLRTRLLTRIFPSLSWISISEG